MKILLVYPKPTPESPQRTPPLSVLYLGAYAARRGHNVSYYDARWDDDWESKLASAEVVGVSSMSGYQLGQALGYLKAAHAARKVTVMGGVHCSLAPHTCRGLPFVDYVVSGEGERTLAELLDCLQAGTDPQGIAGLSTAGYSGAVRSPLPGDEIESPVDGQTLEYFRLASQTNDVMLPASRGCPFACGFCYNSVKPRGESGSKWQPIPLPTWLKDLDRLLDAGIAIPMLQIGDDWLGEKHRIAVIGQALAARGIQWHLSIRANQIDEDLVSRLGQMNCVGVSIGAESGSDEILRLMNKGVTVADTVRAAKLLAQQGIKPLYYFILGVPTETWPQMKQTMELADQLQRIHRGNCSIAFFGFDPLIGTPLHDLAKRLGEPVPKTLQECCERERSKSPNTLLNAIYYIAGLTFHRTKGDKTDKNFPGWRRLMILPFEILCVIRWRLRFFYAFGVEQRAIKWLLCRRATT